MYIHSACFSVFYNHSNEFRNRYLFLSHSISKPFSIKNSMRSIQITSFMFHFLLGFVEIELYRERAPTSRCRNDLADNLGSRLCAQRRDQAGTECMLPHVPSRGGSLFPSVSLGGPGMSSTARYEKSRWL